MPTLLVNSFTEYNFLDEEEYITAAIFTDLQLMALYTERSQIAQRKLSLALEPTNTNAFIMEHEYLRGQLENMDFLIGKHEQAVERLRELRSSQPQDNFQY